MTNENLERQHIANILRDSVVGEDNALTGGESESLADVVLNQYLVVKKDQLPETKHMDNVVYVADQAIPETRSVERVMEHALALLAAAAKLTVIQAEAKKKREEEKNELRLIINSFLGSSQWIKTGEDLSSGEIAAAREIKRLREQVAKIPLAG